MENSRPTFILVKELHSVWNLASLKDIESAAVDQSNRFCKNIPTLCFKKIDSMTKESFQFQFVLILS